MQFRPLRLTGTREITPAPRCDERGYFMRVWDVELAQTQGLTTSWIQENQSYSRRKGIIRGLHCQKPPFSETKLIRVVQGAILDVFVDLRIGSPSYGEWDALELSCANGKMAYIPKGFAHGFCTLTDDVVVLYRVDACYSPTHELGLRWDDPTLGISWPTTDPLVSAKDRQLPLWSEFVSPFLFSIGEEVASSHASTSL